MAMFEKFSERARRVLSRAQEEAQRRKHNYIGTEHILLGLLREVDGKAFKVLLELTDVDKIYNSIDFVISRGAGEVTGDIGLTPRSSKVVELATDEARRMQSGYIGSEHLLIGILRDGGGVAAGVLESMGVTVENVREAVTAKEEPVAEPEPEQRTRAMYLSVEELWRLSNACRPIEEAFGHTVWLVGSSLRKPDYRDVDLRVIISDEEYSRLFIPMRKGVDGTLVGLTDQFRMLMQTSISVLLKQATGLPIDFQVQSQSEANQYSFNEHRRNPVCLRPYINGDFTPQWDDSNNYELGEEAI